MKKRPISKLQDPSSNLGADLEDGNLGLPEGAYRVPQSDSQASLVQPSEGPKEILPKTRIKKIKKKKKGPKPTAVPQNIPIEPISSDPNEPTIHGLAEVRALKALEQQRLAELEKEQAKKARIAKG